MVRVRLAPDLHVAKAGLHVPDDGHVADHHASVVPMNPSRCALVRRCRSRYERHRQDDPGWPGELRRQRPVRLHQARQQGDDHGSDLCPDKD